MTPKRIKCLGIIPPKQKKQNFRKKKIYFFLLIFLLTIPKPLTVDHNKLGKILKEMGIPDMLQSMGWYIIGHD